ncbi:glycosyltransferase [Phaeovulum vinaykumarii]|uniref:Glycosyltransferase, GT2 family n=1 Tax=Phaeovulum vinaykumarii TaxID=407234 RepID=A0A1N7KDB0_9RHOB|nr:glycosyltransferase [Phaeovulum vinaykumarii]SIS59542.1 Glycosyltransferase, GT2 family [Phaeovulum vinaykumarii]SOB94146.1 GT2 family glycosyltransferase [Phaeovulum vinaykumarii]
MIPRLQGLFARYLAQNLHLSCPGPALGDRGQVAAVALRGSRLWISGWLMPGNWQLCDADGPVLPIPLDMAAPDGTPAGARGFSVSVPDGTGPLVLTDGVVRAPIAGPSEKLRRRARRALMPRFALCLARATPLVLRFLKSHDPSLRPRIRKALGLWVEPPAGRLDPALWDGPRPTPPAAARVTLVVPVFNAFDLLPETLERVVRHTDLDWRAIVVEDCSTDARVRPWLRDWAAARNAAHPGRVRLLENAANLGFIGSVNRALAEALAWDDPVILLNSDALVPPNWASRLIAPLGDPQVASVTPMSNDAENTSVPLVSRARPLAPGQGDAIDTVAAGFHPLAGLADLPCGVGFCMAIAPDWLRKAPGFDPAFGRGYGEEVDWSCRLRAMGARHVAQPALFVEHRGGASFGSAEKRRLIETNNRILQRRYPDFGLEVQRFIAADPLATPRLALAIAWAATGADPAPAPRPALPIYLAHALGGGADHWLARRLAEDCRPEGAGAAIVLRVGGPRRWRVELHLPDLPPISGETEDLDLVMRLLAPVARRKLVYSCGVGDPDPAGLPAVLGALHRPGDGLEILFHDYFPLSPAFTLLDADGRWRGVPAADCADPAHRAPGPQGQGLSLADWRARWHDLAARPEARLVVFSQASRAIVAGVWPDLAGRIETRPHRLLADLPRLSPPATPRPALGVLGNINQAKGLEVLAHLARLPGAPRLVVIGNTDPRHPLPASVTVQGDYARPDIPALARRHGIGAWTIPSVWPETFSFTTHEALATGLPVLTFDLGAQAEAAARAPNGHVIALPPEADPAQAAAALARQFDALFPPPDAPG